MRALLRSLTQVGVPEGASPYTVRHIVLQNTFSLIAGGLLLSYVPVTALYLPATRWLVISNLVGSIVLGSSIVLNHFGHFRLHRVSQVLGAIVILIINSLLIGMAGLVPLFLLAVIFVTFSIFPDTERRLMYGLGGLSIATYLGLEVWLHDNAPFLSESDFPPPARIGRLTLFFAFCALAFYNQRVLRKSDQALREEQARSERLLENILPAAIAHQLKSRPGAIADRFEEVTILFADLVNFTGLSARITPEELVRMLDRIFTVFDELADRHGLEKIKTIGDAYMVAGGLPLPRQDHCEAIALMALDMRTAMREIKKEFRGLRIRIGMHTGPVTAGVLGTRKFSYDLWGDSVNTASRMESNGVVGEIQVSAAVAERLSDRFLLKARGPIEIKGKGKMQVFLLKGARAGRTS